MSRVNVSRTKTTSIPDRDVSSLGASYTHIKSLKCAVGPSTKRIVMYHSLLESLDGFETTDGVEVVYLGFNRISSFRQEDSSIKQMGVLDLVGNPITSLLNCPPCKTLIVSSTRIENLIGCPDGVEVVRCGHSTFLKSLKGCPSSVKIIECGCCPNLVIDSSDLPPNLEELID